ncbi:MAG: hypothetical protein N3A66_09690, partial [Planctomycetota bacterium]|nr:hypothetical protein [Planctomycetota bacterium]
EILGWVNADDLLLPGAVAQAVEILGRRPMTAMVYGDAIWIDAQGRAIKSKREIDFDWRIFAYGYCYLPQPATFFRRDAYERAGGIDASLQCCLDADLWHRLCKEGEVVHVPCFWAAIRDHAFTKTRRRRAEFRREHEILRKRYLGCSPLQWQVLHIWHRLRRVALRLKNRCYRPLSEGEKSRLRPLIAV